MRGLTRAGLLALGISIGGSGLPATAWGHHPVPAGAGPWAWLELLLFPLAVVVVLVWVFLEKKR